MCQQITLAPTGLVLSLHLSDRHGRRVNYINDSTLTFFLCQDVWAVLEKKDKKLSRNVQWFPSPTDHSNLWIMGTRVTGAFHIWSCVPWHFIQFRSKWRRCWKEAILIYVNLNRQIFEFQETHQGLLLRPTNSHADLTNHTESDLKNTSEQWSVNWGAIFVLKKKPLQCLKTSKVLALLQVKSVATSAFPEV